MNEPKIKNFDEVEGFVVLSCPMSSMFEYKDFFKVMLTPFELGIALGVYKWDSNLYFDRVLDKTDGVSDCIEDADENDV